MKNSIGGYTYDMTEPLSVLVQKIQELSYDGEFLVGMCRSSATGHAEMEHLEGRVPNTAPYYPHMENDYTAKESTPDDVHLSEATVRREISRIAHDCVDASHFASFEAMAYSLHCALYDNAEAIAKWVNQTRMYGHKEINGKDDVIFAIDLDVGRYVGGGISREGNQYVTSSVRAVLSNFKSTPDYTNTIPFSLTTIYPNIGTDGPGSLYCTGQRFDKDITNELNHMDDCEEKLYWALRANGYDVHFMPSTYERPACVRVNVDTRMHYTDGSPVQAVIDFRYSASDSRLSSIEYFAARNGHLIKMVRDPTSPAAQRITSNPTKYEHIHDAIWEKERDIRDVWRGVAYSYGQMTDKATVDLFPREEQGMIRGSFTLPEDFNRDILADDDLDIDDD